MTTDPKVQAEFSKKLAALLAEYKVSLQVAQNIVIVEDKPEEVEKVDVIA